MKSIKLLTAVFFINSYLLGQSPDKLLPSLAPASPEASSFTKYGNYEVSQFTGVPDISIPLYDIQAGELKVPITLNYHASGIRVTDIPSRVGLGWDLQAGGSITRKIMDKPDELDGNYLDATPTSDGWARNESEIDRSTEDGLLYLNNAASGFYDLQPDIFSYSFPGHSGKFLFNQKDDFSPYLIPSAPVQVNYNRLTESVLALNMKDENGTLYDFGSTEYTSSGGGNPVNATSAWLLTDMTSANQQHNIHFTYTQREGSGVTDSYFSDYLILTDNIVGSAYSGDDGNFYWDLGSISTWWQQLTEIDFENGKVVFEPAEESREDFDAQYQLQKRLSSIKIYSYNSLTEDYTLIRSIEFFHSYFINGDNSDIKRLKLDSIQILTSADAVVQTYRFEYNTSIDLPENTSRMKDYWGYFNDEVNYMPGTSTETMVPQMEVQYNIPPYSPTTITIGGTNPHARDCNPDYMQAYILQKITYPTGGYTEFTYETNQYLDDEDNPQYAGGLRVTSISSYANSSAIPVKKAYKYGVDESGYGRKNFSLEQCFFMSVQNYRMAHLEFGLCTNVVQRKTTTTFFCNPTNDLEGYDGAAVVYPVVTEYTVNGTDTNGKVVQTFLDKPDAKTDIIGLGKPVFDSYHFIRGLPANRAVYKKNADGSYVLVSEDRKGYRFFPFQWSTDGVGLVVYKTVITQTDFSSNNFCGLSWTFNGCQHFDDIDSYQSNSYNVVSGDNKLVSDTVISYDQIDPTKFLYTITNYSYDDIKHLQMSQVQTTDSKGNITTSYLKYPQDFIPENEEITGNTILDAMLEKNMVSKVVEKTDVFTDVNNLTDYVKSSLLNTYRVLDGGAIDLDKVYKLDLAGPVTDFEPFAIDGDNTSQDARYRQMVEYQNYDDKYNITQFTATDEVPNAFSWGYNQMYPVAQVRNASNNLEHTTEYSPATGSSSFTVFGTGTQTLTRTITVADEGDVYVKMGYTGGSADISGYYSGDLGSGSYSFTSSSACGDNTTVTLPDVSPGTYSITITFSCSNCGGGTFGVCSSIEYPSTLATISTTGSKEFFYEGFEEQEYASTDNPCAGKGYYEDNYTVPYAIPNGRDYVIQYHYRDGGVWHAVTEPYEDNMTLTDGDGIDEVRVFPKDAQMTTYTFAPLIGVTSRCDINNHFTYYEYDDMGRLRIIRDEDKNILKKICYNYAGQEVNCDEIP